MEVQLKIIGALLITLAFIHLFFPKYFSWKEDFRSLSLINRQMTIVHSFFIALTVLLMGMICILDPEDLISTRLGHYLSFGLFIFWLLRLLFQFFVYSPKLWKGRGFETFIHIFFSLLWSYLAIIFFLAYHQSKN
ncbi:MAG TPA: hypothetical protein VNS58_09415 [Puia sp.]|nr:hypothetical protein [Puia sp.]